MIKKVEDVTIREWKAIYPNLEVIKISSTRISIYFRVSIRMAECMWKSLNVLNLDANIDTDERIPADIYTEDDWKEVNRHA